MNTKTKNPQTYSIPEKLQNNNLSSGEELIPAEVAARREREGNFTAQPEVNGSANLNKTAGYRVSEQGLINNYPITPPIYTEKKPLAEKRRDYTMISIVGASMVFILLGITALVNMTV